MKGHYMYTDHSGQTILYTLQFNNVPIYQNNYKRASYNNQVYYQIFVIDYLMHFCYYQVMQQQSSVSLERGPRIRHRSQI